MINQTFRYTKGTAFLARRGKKTVPIRGYLRGPFSIHKSLILPKPQLSEYTLSWRGESLFVTYRLKDAKKAVDELVETGVGWELPPLSLRVQLARNQALRTRLYRIKSRYGEKR
jgi:hypothetical protein